MEIRIEIDWIKVYFFIVMLFNLLLFLGFGCAIIDSDLTITIQGIFYAIITFIALITNIIIYVLMIW